MAVFDGQGLSGEKVSFFVKNYLTKRLLENPYLYLDPRKALEEEFKQIGSKLNLFIK